MLDKDLQRRILDHVQKRPCTVQEIAALTGRNWRTAERYVAQLERETGLIATRTFREGTRGALKVVYWNALEAAKGSAYQERLLRRVLNGSRKEEFSPFDIYQFIGAGKREALQTTEEFGKGKDDPLATAQRQVLFLSGNLSWTAAKGNVAAVELLARRRVSMKVLTRIDITSQANVERLLAINQRTGWDAIQVRHCAQPLRGIVVDDTIASLKEVFSPSAVREAKRKTFLFYRISDEEWIGWLQKAFWHLWDGSVDAATRLEALASVRKDPKTL